ncbi:MAG TPA: serine/threonine protein kinase [Myxococcales bacterium]|nr:serine/threonine protein kinase [Myxococcales bacterium]HIN85392.1 serine/threonine protein kinase [Myxococcales bacterium]
MEEILQDKYRILHEVGRGGMAIVYKGLDLSLDREVAIKVLHPHLADRSDSQVRFQREAKAVAKLHHLNILEIYDYSGIDSDQSYIIMEYIRGETLKDFTNRTEIKLPEIGALITIPVAAALAHAHDAGVIHRDIKPENIMIRDDGVIKLMDFGIARLVDTHAMTVTGALVGSPAHMAPEHVEGRQIDNRADVFSTGTLLYLLCTGRLPFDSMSPHALLRQILEVRYDDPRRLNPAIGRRLHAIISRCLKHDPEERFATAGDLEQELRNYVQEIGFEDPELALTRYFEKPPESEQSMLQNVVACLMKTAQDDAESGKVASALEAYNQVLALEGDREDALVQVQRLSSAKSRGVLLRKVALMLSAAALVIISMWSLSMRNNLSAKRPSVSEHAVSPRALLSMAQIDKKLALFAQLNGRTPHGNAARNDRRSLETSAHKVPKAQTKKTHAKRRINGRRTVTNGHIKALTRSAASNNIPFTIKANPMAAEIIFEGKTYTGNTGPMMRRIGRYPVRIHHPACKACEDRNYILHLNSKTPKNGVIFPVGYAPASLVVQTIPTATITAAARTARSGQVMQFKMRKLSTNVTLTIKAPGHKTVIRRVSIHANKTTSISVVMTKVASN